MKKKNKLGKYEKGIIITGVAVLIIFLILLTADGIKNIGKNNKPIALSEQEEVVPPNVPVLSAGMIPVKYEGDNLIICKNDSSWYNYEAGTPAYMMLNDGVYQSELVVDMAGKKLANENIGQPVTAEEQGSIYMWIPRYAYKENGEIGYIKGETQPGGEWIVPDTFSYIIADDTKPNFSLDGIWIEKIPLANTNAVTAKISNMNKEENIYGLIANTVGIYATEEDCATTLKVWLTENASNGIDNSTNTNRTILKVIDTTKHEPIKAKVEYNKITRLVEVTVTFSKYGINKIMLEDTNELNMKSANGIITATTEGISLEAGIYTIAVMDKSGNKKNLKVKVPPQYGREVVNYECEVPEIKWRVFYEDDNNIYLIADDYVLYANLPTSTKGTALDKQTDYRAYFRSISNDYTGSASIRTNTNKNAQKWLNKYLKQYPNSTNDNMKAVAYMMDTKSWSKFAGEKAEYAIGGPTIELFCASYKETHPDRYIECDVLENRGYRVKWSNSSYTHSISGLTQDDYESIYIKSDNTKAYGMWLASNSASGSYVGAMLYASNGGNIDVNSYSYNSLGFRPIVCLKSGTILMDNEDGTYSIQEPIIAKGEYDEEIDQIEIQIRYHEHKISKIMLNGINELDITETNGIITASTKGINLEDGTNIITITDTNGNIKELKIKVPPTRYYGKEVTNYTCASSGVNKWRVFYKDNNNIYLIADDYVLYENLPTSTNGNTLSKGNTDYRASLSTILNDYTGNTWIKAYTNTNAQKWLSKCLNAYTNNTSNNIKAVAYMMDTKSWSKFAGEKAEYAIGGPTLEMFCASYKVTHSDRYVECDNSGVGYKVKWSDGTSYNVTISGLTQDDYNSIYIKSDTTKSDSMWIASPSSNHMSHLMYTYYSGRIGFNGASAQYGFRPVVCLKSGVQLVANGDGTYSIQ